MNNATTKGLGGFINNMEIVYEKLLGEVPNGVHCSLEKAIYVV